MLWLIIGFFIALFCMVKSYKCSTRGDYDGDGIWFFFGLAIPLAVFLLGNAFGAAYTTHKVEEECCWDVHSMEDTHGSQGQFSLFGGQIEDRAVFYYYSEDSETGMLVLRNRVANESFVKEDSENPYLAKIHHTNSNLWLSVFDGVDPQRKWVFHVPENSVTTAVNLNGVSQ